MRKNLQNVFETKDWSNGTSGPRSGHGSTLKATQHLRTALPALFERYEVERFVDAPCGDWTWMQEVDLSQVDYLGCDIAPSLITKNTSKHLSNNVKFEVLDITSSTLPPSDLFLCRECLFHLKFWLRWAFFENFSNSNGRYLMTTIDHVNENEKLFNNGGFKRFDPRLPPFNLPEPLELIPENYAPMSSENLADSEESWKYRSIGVWSIEQVRSAVSARIK